MWKLISYPNDDDDDNDDDDSDDDDNNNNNNNDDDDKTTLKSNKSFVGKLLSFSKPFSFISNATTTNTDMSVLHVNFKDFKLRVPGNNNTNTNTNTIHSNTNTIKVVMVIVYSNLNFMKDQESLLLWFLVWVNIIGWCFGVMNIHQSLV